MKEQGIHPDIRRRVRYTVASLVFAAAALGHSTAGAAEIIIKNDSIPPGTSLPNFIPGERAGAWLTTPVAGDIVGVQIIWSSFYGGAPDSVEAAITVSAAGTFPTPGMTFDTILGPTLVDGVVNEFRYLDPPTNFVPLQISVVAGQTFVVDIEFQNANMGNLFVGSIEVDSDGCQTGLNSILSLPGGWNDAGLLGVSGDFGIRAIIQPIPEPGSFMMMLFGAAAVVRRRKPKKGQIPN